MDFQVVAPIMFIREVQPDWSFRESFDWFKALSQEERDQLREDVRKYYEDKMEVGK